MRAKQRDPRLGRVGEVTQIDTTVIDNLIEDGFIPVVATVAAGEDGGSFNVNADLVAAKLAEALEADKVIFLTDVDGLYADFSDKGSLISALTPDEAEEMIVSDTLEGGMVPKVAACVHALRSGVRAGPHPQRHGAARAAARGLHRRRRRHHDRGRRRGGVMGSDVTKQPIALDAQYVMQTYARKPVMFVRGEGMRLYDDEGREYLDFVSGIGAVNLGHAHPAVTAALCEQAAQLVHVSNLFYVDTAPNSRATSSASRRRWKMFFANSGTEADRGCDQARPPLGAGAQARRIQGRLARAQLPRPHACCARATGQASKQEAFAPMPEGFATCPRTTSRPSLRPWTTTVAAVLLEVVQGEGGVWPLTAEYLAAARRICDEHGCLLIIDEIQTGFFRTGPAFAHQAFGVTPDVITVAKALANGLPIGGLVARDEVAAALQPGDHGSTFGGGPAIRAAGRATIASLIAENLGANALESGRYLQAGLGTLAETTGAITDVRGAGLMVGVSLARPVATEVGAKALERRIVLNTIGTDILRFLPPLVCGKPEIDTLLSTLSDILGESSPDNA